MIHLICYDIESDKIRKKVADRLLADGLERVQYSVFIGPLPTNLKIKLTDWLKEKMNADDCVHDSILIMQLQVRDAEKMTILGQQDLDLEGL